MVPYMLVINSKYCFCYVVGTTHSILAHFLDSPIKSIRLDDVGDIKSKAFYECCKVFEIDIEHLVSHVHT